MQIKRKEQEENKTSGNKTMKKTVLLLLLMISAMGTVLGSGCPRPEEPPFMKASLPQDVTQDKGDIGIATPGGLLQGPRARGEKGDWVLRNDLLWAVFRKENGQLVDLGFRRDAKDILHYMDTVVSDTRDRYRVYYHAAVINEETDPPELELIGKVRDRDLNLEVRTRIKAPAGRNYLQFDTTVRNVSTEPVYGVGIGDSIYMGNGRVFIPGHGVVKKSSTVHGHWAAREAPGFTMALVSGEKDPMGMVFRVGLPGFNPTIQAVAKRSDLETRETMTARRYLVLVEGPMAQAGRTIQNILGGPVTKVKIEHPDEEDRTRTKILVKKSELPVLFSSLDETSNSTNIVLSGKGPYRAALWIPGAGTGPWKTISRQDPPERRELSIALRPPDSGLIDYRVTDPEGNLLPARLFIEGKDEIPDPDFGEDGFPEGVLNMIYTAEGKGQKRLAPGNYRITFLHGTEYSIQTLDTKVEKNSTAKVNATLARSVYSPTALIGDLHLHANPSYDSPLTTRQRLVQLLAENVQIAVATDHNAVADYGEEAEKEPFAGRIKTFPGCEVTTRRSFFGHFNLFPLTADEPVPLYRNASPQMMVEAWKKVKPRPIIQINHPRLSFIGSFNQMNLDRRRGKAYGPGFFTDFDAVEVFNGCRIYSPKRVEENLRDWYLLLNKGLRPTATGGSDAHLAGFHEVGYPKNYIFTGHEDPAALDEKSFIEAIRNNRVVVSTGPFLNITKAQDDKSETLIGTQQRGPVTVDILVKSPAWLPVDTLEIIANGKSLSSIKISPNRPPKTPEDRNAFEWRKQVELSPSSDTWYVFIVRSKSKNKYLYRPEGVIMAFSNPIWIDADGDGDFTPGNPPVNTPTR